MPRSPRKTQRHSRAETSPPVAIESLRRRAGKVLSVLRTSETRTSTALKHSTPLELLIATILSAQCTDERVNLVTVSLFKKYTSATAFANANLRELEADIRSTGFFRAKAKNIVSCCRTLVERHHGMVPDSMEELVQLAGVGRKTANVVLGTVFHKSAGIVVDTHVKRVALRLGLTTETDPEKVELELMELIPNTSWIELGNFFIWHGRTFCNARRPKCTHCPLADHCPSADVFAVPASPK